MLTNKLTGAGSAAKTYIEDVFSTYLYTGNNSTQTINNGIDLAGKGGMFWMKNRTTSTGEHTIIDTARGNGYVLRSNGTNAQFYGASGFGAAASNGFSLSSGDDWVNASGSNYTSWTFRKAPKFFDVVTYTGNNTSYRSINHSLGTTPGMIIVKALNSPQNWWVYHRSLGGALPLNLNTTDAASDYYDAWNNADPTSTSFIVGSGNATNGSGLTYVAYIFAHDTTTDGLIQCGSYTGNGSATGPTVTIGWEPQYLMIKNASGVGNWQIIDNMRGMSAGSADATLQANLSNAESSVEYVSPTATGFQVTSTSTEVNTNSSTYIYMAIRRGPMKTPTDGKSVFDVNSSGIGSTYIYPIGFYSNTDKKYPPDAIFYQSRSTGDSRVISRLQGDKRRIVTTSTSAEVVTTDYPAWSEYTPAIHPGVVIVDGDGSNYAQWIFRRAPGFFDVVCYTGTGVARTVNHNLGAAPELMIVKKRSAADSWYVGGVGYYGAWTSGPLLNSSDPGSAWSGPVFNNTAPTSSVFSLGSSSAGNASGATFVAYLFASCPGVSKIGSYTGNGSSQTINCGFTNGARFVLIKRTDSTGDWYVWDTARGIVTGNDPHLSLNTTAAEVTTNDTIDPTSTGFIVNQVAATNVNVSGGTYIYLAIA